MSKQSYSMESDGLEYLVPQLKYSTTYKSSYTPVKPDYNTKAKWGQIKGDITNQTDLWQIIQNIEDEISHISPSGNVFTYKGQVAKESDLPNGASVGDVYDVTETGANYVWNGSNWDKLSENIDLSDYAKIEDVYTKTQAYSKLEVDTLLDAKADIVLIYSKGEINDLLADKASVQELNIVAGNLQIETQARDLADSNLQDAIDKVADDLQKHIDEAETGYVTNAQLNQEIANRENADTALSGRLDTLEGKDFVEYKDISNPENPNRKAIILDNHDGIFGKDIDGNTRMLGMISKYNVADFGSQHLHTNLNTQQIVTVNDNQAVLTDKNIENIILPGSHIDINTDTQTDPATGFIFKTLTVNANLSEYYNKTEIDDLIQDMDVGQLRNDLDQEIQDRQDVDDALETRIEALEDGATTIFHWKGSVATLAALEQIQNPEIGDVYNVEETGANYAWTGTEWDKLSETIDLTPYDLKADREASERNIISKLWSNNTMNGGHLYTKMINNKGGYALIFNEEDGGGSQVYDKTDDVISYVGTNLEEGNGAENGVNVQIYSKNKTTNEGVRINVNTQKAYYLKGANVPNSAEREIAVVDDINTAKTELQEEIAEKASQSDLEDLQETVDNSLAHQDGNIQALLLQMTELQEKIEDLKSLDYEVVTFYDGGETEYNNPAKDFQLSGLITTPAVITSNSLTLKEATMTATYADLYADQDITIKNSSMNGSVPKATSNAIYRLRANGYIRVADTSIAPEKAYNAIECNLTEALAKSIIIDNVDFNGPITNNAITVFGMADYGVLTISNCHFKKVSNMLRISNRTNTTWTINIVNCTVDEWETGEYGGAILLQDYTSKSAEEVATRNEFKNLTINIQNLTKPDGTKLEMPEDLSTICGTKDNNQILYVYDAFNGVRTYNSNIYPTINII